MKWLLSVIGISPYAIIAFIAAGTGLFFFGRYEGGHAQRLEDSAADLKTEQAVVVAVHQEEIKFTLISTNVETKIEELRLVYTALQPKAEKVIAANPLYLSKCFDDSGMQIANAALSAAPADPGKPRPALSVLIAPGGRDGSLNPSKDRGD